MPRLLTNALFTLLILGITACSTEPDATDYFPLNEGLNWDYHYQLITPSDKQKQGTYTVTNIATTQINSQIMTIRRTNDNRDFYLMQKPDGIYRYASRTLFETHPVVDNPPRMVLPLPTNDSDRRWSSATTSYVINMVGPSTIVSANAIQDFVMNYRIVSRDETVEVAAGRFENCLLVEGDATLTMFADPLTGYQDIPIKTREWYAPGVGLVKLERTEPLDARVFKGGRYVFELVEFSW